MLARSWEVAIRSDPERRFRVCPDDRRAVVRFHVRNDTTVLCRSSVATAQFHGQRGDAGDIDVKCNALVVSTFAGVLALALLGCGGSPGTGGQTTVPAASSQSASAAPTATPQPTSTPAASGALDACALATQSEINAAAGVSLGPPTPQPPPNPGSVKCSWPGAGPAVGGLVEPGITIGVVPLPAGTSAQQLPFFSGQIPGARPISGLGDAAVAFSPGPLGPHSVEIYVAMHGSLITLALVTASPHTADPVQSMTTLAHAAVGRFP